MIRPKSILWFERLLGLALAIDLTVNLASWPAISARLAAQGLSASPVLIVLIAAASPLLGAILLYFVARRRSRIARWVVTLLVVAATIAFVVVIAGGRTGQLTPLFALTVLAELMKLIAVTRLFTSEAAAWFARPTVASAG
jgi:hypothetical protein